MKLVHAERLGEAFDSQLVIGVRESYGMSCTDWSLLPPCFSRWIFIIQSWQLWRGWNDYLSILYWFFCVWYVIPIKFCLKSLTSKWFSYISVTAKSVFSKSNYFLTFRVADITLCSFLYCFWLFRHFEEGMLNRLHLRLSVFFAKQICVSETFIFHHYLLLLQSFAACWIKLVANTLSDGFIDVQFKFFLKAYSI